MKKIHLIFSALSDAMTHLAFGLLHAVFSVSLGMAIIWIIEHGEKPITPYMDQFKEQFITLSLYSVFLSAGWFAIIAASRNYFEKKIDKNA